MRLFPLATLSLGLLLAAGCSRHAAESTEEQASDQNAANESLKRGQTEMAIDYANKVIESNAKSGVAFVTRAEARRQAHDLTGAMEDVAAAIKLQPADPKQLKPEDAEAYDIRGRIERDQGDKKGALADFDRAIEINPKLAAAYLDRGTLNEKLFLTSDLNQAIELDPTNARAYYERARAAHGSRRPEALGHALADLNKAIKLSPNYVEAYLERGAIESEPEIGDAAHALDDFDHAVRLDAERAEAYDGRGYARLLRPASNAREALEQYRRAIEDFDHALRLNSKLAVAHVHRAQAEMGLAKKEPDLAAAEKDLQQAIELDPNYAEAYMQRGQLKALRAEMTHSRTTEADLDDLNDDLEKAVFDYDKAIKIEPRNADFYYRRGLAKMEIIHFDDAIDDFSVALQLGPAAPAAVYFQRGLAHFQKADANHLVQPKAPILKQDLEAAVADLGWVTRNAPNPVAAYDYLGQARKLLGQPQLAVKDFDKAISLDVNFAAAFFHRAHAYEDSGDLPHAIEDYTRAIELDKNQLLYLIDRGGARLKLSQRHEAEQDFDAAIILQDDPAAKKNVEKVVAERRKSAEEYLAKQAQEDDTKDRKTKASKPAPSDGSKQKSGDSSQ